MTDERCLAVLAVVNRDLNVIRSPKTICNDDMTASRNRIESVDLGTVEMFKRMLAAARIQRVAVGQERKSALLLHDIRNCLCIIRPQIRKVPEFAPIPAMRISFCSFAVRGTSRCVRKSVKYTFDFAFSSLIIPSSLNFRSLFCLRHV